jgi:hypothetical protein
LVWLNCTGSIPFRGLPEQTSACMSVKGVVFMPKVDLASLGRRMKKVTKKTILN